MYFADLLGALEDATKRLQRCGCGFPRKPTRDDLAKRTEPLAEQLLHLATKRERAKVQKDIDKIEVEWVKERATHELAECRAARCKDEIRAILRAAKDATPSIWVQTQRRPFWSPKSGSQPSCVDHRLMGTICRSWQYSCIVI